MRRLLLSGAVLLTLGSSAALGATGSPPAGMSPIAGSLYRAQFALCSLERIDRLAQKQHVALTGLTSRAAASRVAQSRDGDLGSAAVQGCRAGLLYRLKNDRTVSALRFDLSSRITAEKYVAAAYGTVMFGFFFYVLIHAAKVARLSRETDELLRRLERIVSPDAS